jgi:L,D-transpeptidase ErfK/SrfK
VYGPRAGWGALGIALFSLAAAAPPTGFEALPLPIGESEADLVAPGDTLLDVAHRHRVGFELLERLNPSVDRWIPKPGTVVLLPTRSLPPRVEPRGLVINLPEMRLYDFTPAGGAEVFHVAIGDGIDPTLLGAYRVGEKRIDPAWRVPESIRREKPELPAVVPPGPDNPLGDRWMTIGTTSYGIHGTNNPWSIGRQATHGCVRLYADEMRRLYDRTPGGTPLQIVYQPYKWGRDGDAILLEVHPDAYGRVARPLDEALALPRELGLLSALDLVRVTEVLVTARGVPERVGQRPAPGAATSGPTW